MRQNCSTTHPYRDIDPQSRFLGGDRGGIRGGAGGSIFGIFKNKGEVQSSLFGAFRKSKNYVSNSKTDPRTMVRNSSDGKKGEKLFENPDIGPPQTPPENFFGIFFREKLRNHNWDMLTKFHVKSALGTPPSCSNIHFVLYADVFRLI